MAEGLYIESDRDFAVLVVLLRHLLEGTMAVSKARKQAVRRMRLVNPENAHRVVGRSHYWTPEFIELYLQRVDTLLLENPQDAYRFGEFAPWMAKHAPIDPEQGFFQSENSKASWQVRALATFGSACRVAGRLEDGRRAFQDAFAVMDDAQRKRRPIETVAQAELLRRYGAFLFTCEDPRARQAFDRAIELYRVCGWQEGLALALCVRGLHQLLVDKKSGIADFGAAIELVNTRTALGRRIAFAVLSNMALSSALVEAPFSDLQVGIEAIRVAKKMSVHSVASVEKAKLSWVEGLLSTKLGDNKSAVRLVNKARNLLQKLGEPFEFALCSIDLAVILHLEGSSDKIEALVGETERVLRNEMAAEPFLLTVLAGWSIQPVLPFEATYRAMAAAIRREGSR